jgi:hypothetical protein
MKFLKRRIVVSLALSCVTFGAALASDELSIAVLAPTIAPAAQEVKARGYDIQDIVRMLEEGLRNSGRFIVYDRDKTNEAAVLSEQAFALSGKAEGNAAEFGKLKNVNLIVQPTISLFKSEARLQPSDENPGRFRKQEKGLININYKVLDTTTLQIKFTLNVEAQSDAQSTVSNGSDTVFSNQAWQNMIQIVTKKSVASIGDRVFPLLVVRFQNKQVFLNRGEGAGLEVGDVKEVFSTSEEMIDPGTGKSLGAAEDSLGKVRITRISPKFSVAVPVGELGGEPKTGDTVR